MGAVSAVPSSGNPRCRRVDDTHWLLHFCELWGNRSKSCAWAVSVETVREAALLLFNSVYVTASTRCRPECGWNFVARSPALEGILLLIGVQNRFRVEKA